MKFTPSSSVSSTSSTTTSTNTLRENFYTSKGNVFGCFSGVLSRILCSKSLPTHPSDPLESDKQQHFFKFDQIVVDSSGTSNVVARLMGLDSMPETGFKTSSNVSDSITRSRSLNSEHVSEETEEIQVMQRRGKMAFSFKETQNFFELESDDFFVLNFENKAHKSEKKGSKFGNKHRGRKDKCVRKQRKNREEQGKDRVYSNEDRLRLKISARNSQIFESNVDVQNQSYHLSPLKDKPSCRKEESDGTKAKKKERYLSDCKEECDSENSSPVSVLDHREFTSDPETTTSEEDVKLRAYNEGGNFVSEDVPCDQSDGSSITQERYANGNIGLKRSDYRNRDNVQMLNTICRLAATEINNSNWKYNNKLEIQKLEDVGEEFGQQIFDQLVSELVDQLVELNLT